MWLVSGKNCPMHDNFGERTKVRSGRKYASDMLPESGHTVFPRRPYGVVARFQSAWRFSARHQPHCRDIGRYFPAQNAHEFR